MVKICPNPTAWYNCHKRLKRSAEAKQIDPRSIPIPLILNGWMFSSDLERQRQWQDTVEWANQHGLGDLVDIPEHRFFFTDNPTDRVPEHIWPHQDRNTENWDYDPKVKPAKGDLDRALDFLKENWDSIAGPELSQATIPQGFAGDKGRRLVVLALQDFQPPWGDWDKLSDVEEMRRAFTRFRGAVNKAISPHEVDHIDFETEVS